MQNLVRVSKMKGLPFKLPFEPQTFYKWWHLGKYPEIFVKFGGGLFVDLDPLERVMEKARLRGNGDGMSKEAIEAALLAENHEQCASKGYGRP